MEIHIWNGKTGKDGDVLLRALLVDDMKWGGVRMSANLCVVYTINCVE